MKVLITGFEPFGGQSVNPAYEAVKALPERIGEKEIFKAEIPTAFRREFEVLRGKIAEIRPDAVICVGQAGGRAKISLERVAINVMDARMADNDGFEPTDEPIEPKGPAAYFTRLPIRRIEERLKAKHIPCLISNTAGTYVCNDIMYRLLHGIAVRKSPMLGGFVHVPYLPEQAAGLGGEVASMELGMIVEALKTVIEALE